MQVHLLGPVEVVVGGETVDLGGPRSRALVARLALAAPHAVAVDTLVDDLWGADPPRNAHNALQSVVSRTRSRLPDGVLTSSGGGYRLVVAADDVDAHRFTRLAGEGRRREALGVWSGAALDGLDDAPFVVPATAALEERRIAVLEDSLEDEVSSGRYDPAGVVAELTGLVDAHPYRERLWAALMRVLAATGRTADALAAYERMRVRLADDLGLDPSPMTQAVQQEILSGEVAASAPREAPPSRTNLRTALTSFVGREQAVAELSALVTSHRLVTLVGPGGAGKTRLAAETAARVAASYPDGVWMIELAAVTDPADILDAVVGALDLREVVVLDRAAERRVDDRTRLVEALTGRQVLLVADNCEHLVADVAAVTEDLLQALPELRVVATSREPLDLLGEVVLPVAPLDVPMDGTTPREALQHSAVDLFVQRARAAAPAFVLDDATLPAVLEICRRLDGQPLALELAAARLRTLTASQVAARLGDRFRLLTGGSRTALPRHRTLRAVVEWSWDLLDEAERVLAERVAVFPAGISVPAAAAIVGIDEAGALDLLTALADKSLLAPIADNLGEPRFRMLETLREYGTDRLVERGEADAVRRAHLAYFRRLAHDLEPRLRRREQIEALAVLDDERGNLLAAVSYAIDSRDGDSAAWIASDLAWYFSLRGQHDEIADLSARVLAMDVPLPPTPELVCVAMRFVAQIDDPRSRAGRGALIERIAALREDPDLDREAPTVTLILVATDLFSTFGDDTGRVDVSEIDMSAALEHRDPWVRSAARFVRLAWQDNAGAATRGDEDDLAHALEGFREVGDRWGQAMGESTLASAYERAGKLDVARDHLQSAVELLDELGADRDAGQLRARLVWLAVGDQARTGGDVATLRRDLAVVAEEARSLGHRDTEAYAQVAEIDLERWVGDRETAWRLATRLVTELESDGSAFRAPQFRAIALSASAVATLPYDAAAARAYLARAAAEARRARDMPIAALVATTFAVLAAHDGDAELAARRLGAARQIRGADDLGNCDTVTLTDTLGESLGRARFDALVAEGAALSREDALALALPES
ncbi:MULTISPECIES: ATP-binding protein [Mumia]|uniref:ATP-binding protein n=1 Tax=Mumia xiangluensis TaxID=1678900 RepID=A0ABW1QPR4_9ACTN|nr:MULTISPECIES: BTAD domain-containing putative transcriptional regulator [Mumia]